MFKFTVRELVLLTLVVRIGVDWSLDRRSLASSLKTANDGQRGWIGPGKVLHAQIGAH